MKTQEFFHLYPTGMHPCTPDKRTHAAAIKSWLCPGCGAPKSSVDTAIDIQIQESIPKDAPITFVSGCGLVLARSDFLEQLGETHVRTDLLLGKVSDPAGFVLPDWITLRARHRVIIRGSKNVSHRRCDICGRQVYFAMGAPYLFPAPVGAFIYESDLYGLLIHPDLFSEKIRKRWPDLGVEVLKVAAEAKDSLGELT